jgi:phosphate starvation-inducible membrane PsiE
MEYLMEIDSELRSKETWLISDDGLWDIFFGLVLLGWGLTTSLNHPIWFISAIMVAYFLVVMAGKEVITRPRMTYFSIADGHLIRLFKSIRIGLAVIISGMVFGALTFWVFDFGFSIQWLPNFGANFLWLALSVIMLVFGYLSPNGFRYYFYAGISFLTFIIFEFISPSSLPLVFSAALLLTVTGICLLVRFVFRFPKSKAQENVQY